jgi:hypothetical protein
MMPAMLASLYDHPRLLFALVCFGGSALMAWITLDAIRQGYIDVDSKSDPWWRYWSNRVGEDDSPIQFWIQIIVHGLACIGLFVFGVVGLVKHLF